jgi:hypothetical protein
MQNYEFFTNIQKIKNNFEVHSTPSVFLSFKAIIWRFLRLKELIPQLNP